MTERLITYDTSQPDGIRACAGFIKGWLEAREIEVHDSVFGELPVLTADIGPQGGATPEGERAGPSRSGSELAPHDRPGLNAIPSKLPSWRATAFAR